MKNIFNILYYTGISIMMGFVLIISLFAMNIQNILDTFAKEKVEVNIYVKDTSAYVIKPIQKQPAQIPTNKPKANQHLSVIKIENRTEDSNQVKVNLESEKSVEEPKDTNKPKTP
jgi:cell division protein FtsX